MSNNPRLIDPLPDEVASYEEAADFWDRHDTMDYPDNFDTVATQAEFKQRRYDVDVISDKPKTGAELVAYWQREGLIGSRPEIDDS
jgi:hypothetical protein